MTSLAASLQHPKAPYVEAFGLPAPDVGYGVHLLTGFRLERWGHPIDLSESSQRVIGLLAIAARPVPRSIVAGTLWLDADDARAAACLRSTLWRIRIVAPGLIDAESNSLNLTDGVMVDFSRAKEAARGLVVGSRAWSDRDTESLLQSGDLLPDWSEEWVILERELFRQLRLHALEILCTQLAAAGHSGRAIVAGIAAVQAEPLRESAHRALIAAHLTDGNVTEALRQYALYSDLLERELGIQPSAALSELIDRHGNRRIGSTVGQREERS